MDCWKSTCWHCPPDIYIRTLFNCFGNRNFIFLASPNDVIFSILFIKQIHWWFVTKHIVFPFFFRQILVFLCKSKSIFTLFFCKKWLAFPFVCFESQILFLDNYAQKIYTQLVLNVLAFYWVSFRHCFYFIAVHLLTFSKPDAQEMTSFFNYDITSC